MGGQVDHVEFDLHVGCRVDDRNQEASLASIAVFMDRKLHQSPVLDSPYFWADYLELGTLTGRGICLSSF